jgi:hypothetical protein
MNAIITQYKKVVLVAVAAIAMGLNGADIEKCKPCAAAAAARLSAQAAHAAALAAGKPVSREMELDTLNPAATQFVQACCEFCAEVGSFGCQGENASRCAVCQAGMQKLSIAEAAAALAAANAIVNKRKELDDLSRAPREELADPCGPCDGDSDCGINVCDLNCKLQAIFNCCVNTNQQVRCQGVLAEKCCKKLNRKLNDLEDATENFSVIEGLIGSQIDQSADCCSVIDVRLGELDGSAFDIPDTNDIIGFVNGTDADVVTWLKSLYVLAYNVWQCTCL